MTERLIDESVLQGLVEALGDRPIVRGIVAVYLTELDARIEAIATAAPRGRAIAAHALKSPSATLGVIAMQAPAQRIEHTPDDEGVFHESLASLRASRVAVVAALTRW